MKKPLISIVVPIYNVEKYLQKCIDSIVNQTYNNIEILLINDGTQDNCLEICNKNAKKDNRIKVISQVNQGLSEARNTGIKNANGEFICFIDSDDYIDKNYVELLVKDAIENNADISVCDFWYVNNEGKTWTNKYKKNEIYESLQAIEDIFVGAQNTEMMTWNKLYKLSLFIDNKIFFPKGKLHEDNFVTYKLFYYANKISLIPNKLYYYLQRDNSIMGKKFNVKRIAAIEAVEDAKTFLTAKDIHIEEQLNAYEAKVKVYILDTMIKDKFRGKEKKDVINNIKKNKKEYLKNKYLDKKIKFAIFILIGNGNLYKFALLFYNVLRKRK